MKFFDLLELSGYAHCKVYIKRGIREIELEWDPFAEKYRLYDEAEWTFEELYEKEVLSIHPYYNCTLQVVLNI